MENFSESRLYKVINGKVGLASILFALIFFIIIIVIYVIRTYQARKNLFNELYSYLTGDAQRTTAKLLRSTIFLLLAVGFVAVIYYNVKKMLTDDPLVTVSVKDNVKSPSILFCIDDATPIEMLGAGYFDSLDDLTDENPKLTANLTNSFNNIIMGKGGKQQMNCILFNETLSTKPKEKVGGVYNFILNAFPFVFIGDFNNLDESHSFPQGSVHGSIGTQLITNSLTILTYDETSYEELDGGKIHRGFQFSLVGSFPSDDPQDTLVDIIIIAPKNVITDTEEPSLDLAVFFGNLGGYLTICGIFGFLFGSGKISPFGFVTEYCFQYKDLENRSDKIGNDLEKGDDKDEELEMKFESLLKKYYVDVEHFEQKNQPL